MLQHNTHSDDASQLKTISTAITRTLQTWIKSTIIDDDPYDAAPELEAELLAKWDAMDPKLSVERYMTLTEPDKAFLVYLRSYVLNLSNL